MHNTTPSFCGKYEPDLDEVGVRRVADSHIELKVLPASRPGGLGFECFCGGLRCVL